MIGGIALRSGSSGNAILLRNQDKNFVIDCGINGKTFAASLAEAGVAPQEIDGILITHDHIDHTSGLGVVLRRYKIPFYITEPSFQAIRTKLGRFDAPLLNLIEADARFEVADTLFESFRVPHDAAETVAFRMTSAQGDITVCTDIGAIDETVAARLRGSRLIFLEANYDPDLLRSGPYPYYLKERIRNGYGHLSNEHSGNTLRELIRHGTEQIVLAHLSQENNHPDLATLTVKQCLAQDGAECMRDYQMQVAKRYAVSTWVRI